MSGRREKRHNRTCKYCENIFKVSHAKCKTIFCSRKCSWDFRRLPIEKRFMNYVLKTNDCWIWTSTRCPKGYGHFQIGKIAAKAHRVSYEIFKGQFDRSLHILHSCDNPSCVNPDHLSLGTNADNVFDSMKKGRRFTKVSFRKVNKIRDLKKNGMRNCAIAKLMRLHRDYVSQIVTNKIRTMS